MLSFIKLFYQIVNENNIAGEGGVFGGNNTTEIWSASGTNIDYAPNDTRIPKILGKRKKSKKRSKILRRHG